MSELSILAAKLELEAKELEEFLTEHLAGKSNQDDRQALLTVCRMLGVQVPEELQEANERLQRRRWEARERYWKDMARYWKDVAEEHKVVMAATEGAHEYAPWSAKS